MPFVNYKILFQIQREFHLTVIPNRKLVRREVLVEDALLSGFSVLNFFRFNYCNLVIFLRMNVEWQSSNATRVGIFAFFCLKLNFICFRFLDTYFIYIIFSCCCTVSETKEVKTFYWVCFIHFYFGLGRNTMTWLIPFLPNIFIIHQIRLVLKILKVQKIEQEKCQLEVKY